MLQGQDVTIWERSGLDMVEEVELVAATRPEVIFLDVQMPPDNGFDLLPRLEHIDPLPAVVFVTAFDRYALRAFEVHALDYLTKPVHPDRLARFGRELIEWIISRAGARLIFQDQIVDRPRGSEAELAADLLAVVHVFSCRANGKRRYKRAKHGGETGAKQYILEPEPGREEVQEIGTGCSTRSADDAVSTGTPPTYTSSTSMASTMAHGFQAHV